jgi:heme A synthase
MKQQRVVLCAIMAALVVGIVIGLGALLTSEIRAMPGGPASTVTAPSLEQAHRLAGYAAAVITVGLAIMAQSLVGWLALAAMLAEVALGSIPIAHATLSPVCFALIVATGVLNSKSWQEGPKPVASTFGALRTLSLLVPILVFIQIGLGAAYRHNHMGVISHIMNALIVLTIALIPGVAVLRTYPDHPVLRPAALALVITAGVQVFLGFAVYLILLMSSENNMGLIVTGVVHVLNGAFTFAASLVFAIAARRNLIQSGV